MTGPITGFEKKNKLWLIAGSVAVLLIAWLMWRNQKSGQKAAWETAQLANGAIELIISSSGTLNAINTVEVGTQVSGVIEEIKVDFNDVVKKGQLIAKLDIRNLQAALQRADAALLQADVQVSQARRAYTNAQKYNSGKEADLSVVEAEAALQQVKTQLEQAEREYERYKKLYEDGVVAKTDFETKLTEYERLKAGFQSMSATLDRTKANVSNVDLQKSLEDLKTAQANLASMKAAREQAKINLDYAYIRAPIDGIVLSRNVEVGQTVAASLQTPVLFAIANDLTKMEIEASVDEADIGFIKTGQPVVFTVDAYLDITFEGTVEEIRLQPQIVSNVVTYTVIVSAPNKDQKLMPGMTANLDVLTAQRSNVLKAPAAALSFTPPEEYVQPWREYLQNAATATQSKNEENGGSGVLWILEGDRPVPKLVKTGLSDGSFTEISGGELKEGQSVITGMNGGTVQPAKNNQQNSPFMPARPGSRTRGARN